MSTFNKTIGFRLNAEEFQSLSAEALRNGASEHEFARSLVLKSLNGVGKISDKELPSLQSEVAAIRSDIVKLRIDLSITLETILVVTRVFAPEEAQKFISEKLHREISEC